MSKTNGNEFNAVAPILREFRLTTMLSSLEDLTAQARGESWDYPTYLQRLCEVEWEARHGRKLERLLKDARLPAGKTLATLDEQKLSVKLRRTLKQLLEGSFVEKRENVMAFGLPGRGKTHYLCAVAHELVIRHQYRVYFTATFKLVQQLLTAKADLRLEAFLKKLDRFDVIILDDIGYVKQTREEMEVLFTFFAERYERKSVMISSNRVFSEWDQIFHDPMTAMAAVDRLVHHSVLLEFDGKSFRASGGKKESP
jgi:DNA replication protein DnaC